MVVAVPDKILKNKYVTIEDAMNDVIAFYYEHYNTILTMDDIYFCIERAVKRELYYVMQSLKEKNVPIVENSQTIFIDEEGINIYYFININGRIEIAQFNKLDPKRIRNMISIFAELLSQTIEMKILMPEAQKLFEQRVVIGTIEQVVDKNVIVSVKSKDYTIKGVLLNLDQVDGEKKYYKPPYQMYFYVKKVVKTRFAPILFLSRNNKLLVTYLLLKFSKEEQQKYIQRFAMKPRIITVLRFHNSDTHNMTSIVWSNVILKSTTIKTVSRLLNNETIRIKKLS
jgi:K+/H+ antiporter YhaU regulatory subunit KhtT